MKKDFPILNDKNLHYLDNAATTQKPKIVLDTLQSFYANKYSSPHRGIYKLSSDATKAYEDARQVVAKHLNARNDEIVFVRNCTEAMNAIAFGIDFEGDILLTEYEHHSNYLPWKRKAAVENKEYKMIPIEEADTIYNHVNSNTGLVAITAMSNVTGKILDLPKIIKKIKEKNPNCLVAVDAAQAMPHMLFDVKKLDIDFLGFSGHKVYGPNGSGAFFGKITHLKSMQPYNVGGGMVKDSLDMTWKESPHKFEAGTMNVAENVALSKSLLYVRDNIEKIHEIETELRDYLLKRLKEEDIRVFGHEKGSYGPVVSFAMKDIHPHDVASIVDRFGVCIRAGHHCAQPLMKKFGVSATSRASISFYNTKKDVDQLIKGLREARSIIHG